MDKDTTEEALEHRNETEVNAVPQRPQQTALERQEK